MIRGNRNKYEKVIRVLDIQPQDRLFEIGYGPGDGINMIAQTCPLCTIHGIDFSELMYKKAAKSNREYLDKRQVVLQHGDFIKTPIVTGEYDKVFCVNVIYFWDELQSPFKKVLSLLKPGGAFYIYMATKETLKNAHQDVFNKYSIEQVVAALQRAGFGEVEHHLDRGYIIKANK